MERQLRLSLNINRNGIKHSGSNTYFTDNGSGLRGGYYKVVIKKTHIVIIVSLAALLLSGCSDIVQKSNQSNTPTKTPLVVSGQITDAEFALNDKNVWIALNAIKQDSFNTEILHSTDNGQTWSSTNEKNLYILSKNLRNERCLSS